MVSKSCCPHVDSRKVTTNKSIWSIICDKHWNVSTQCLSNLPDRSVSTSKRLVYFNSVVASVACFCQRIQGDPFSKTVQINRRSAGCWSECFISRMRGSGLLQQSKPIHRHTSLAIFVNLTKHRDICWSSNFNHIAATRTSHWRFGMGLTLGFVCRPVERSSWSMYVEPLHWNRLAIAVQFWPDLGN